MKDLSLNNYLCRDTIENNLNALLKINTTRRLCLTSAPI